jgi:hypothetical protein
MKPARRHRPHILFVRSRDDAPVFLHAYPQNGTGAMKAIGTILFLGAITLALQANAQLRTPQYPEDDTVVVELEDTTPTQVCHPDAEWVRLGFASIELHGTDKLVLSSSEGDELTLSGTRWNGRVFHTRALRGDCVTIEKTFNDNDSDFELSDYQAGLQPLDETKARIAAAGDICDSTPLDCKKTSDLVIAADPTMVLALGDNAYVNGTLDEFNTRYDPNWGRFKDITAPVPGNHEYLTTSAAGYFDYFNGVGEADGPAGERTKGYYSFDVGEWHFIALNSKSGGAVSATQLAWLDADLRANTKPCTAAYMHYPFISSGRYTTFPNITPIMARLYAARVDLLLTGHDHDYQRFAPMDSEQVAQSDGVREVITGTGGGDKYTVVGTHPLYITGRGDTFGVLRLDLTGVGYDGKFVPVAGKTWTDSFSRGCNRADELVGDYILTASPTISVTRGSSGAKVITVASYGAFNSLVKLANGTLPSGVTATWLPYNVTPLGDGSATGRVTLRVSNSATKGTYPIAITGTYAAGTSDERVRKVSFTLTVK